MSKKHKHNGSILECRACRPMMIFLGVYLIGFVVFFVLWLLW